jgi:hypothetical protein
MTVILYDGASTYENRAAMSYGHFRFPHLFLYGDAPHPVLSLTACVWLIPGQGEFDD